MENGHIKDVGYNDVYEYCLLGMIAESNPFKCSCNLKPFLISIDWSHRGSTSVQGEICLLSDIENSLQKHTYCPSMCSCRCTEHANDSYLVVDCQSSNLYTIPHFVNYNLETLEDNETGPNVHQFEVLMYESQNDSFSFYVEDDIKEINLENNNLKFLDASQIPPNLFHLYLSNNKLRFFPDYIFDSLLNLQQVSLSGNPWICNCNTLKFKNWLTTYRHIISEMFVTEFHSYIAQYILLPPLSTIEKVIYSPHLLVRSFLIFLALSQRDMQEFHGASSIDVLDIDNVRCGESDKGKSNLTGSVIWLLHDSDLCPSTSFELLLSMSFVVPICIILCLYAKSLYAKYKLNINMFLYSLGCTSVKEENPDYEKIFDSFISFSHEDDEFVIREVISEIERRLPNIRLCLHFRHFTPGVLIHTNIIDAVQNSKTTVLIISRNFLNSEWCLVEFRTAYIQQVEDKLHRIIVVKFGDLPKKMDPTIEAFLKSTTYLTWGEPNFWNKMIFVLPSRPTAENQDLDNAVDNNIVFNFSVSEF